MMKRTIILVLLLLVLPLLCFCGKPKYDLVTSVSPSGGGTITPASGTYNDGTNLTITAEPASGYRFDQWSGDAIGTSSTVTLTMDSDKSVTANFIAQYNLTTSASPSGGGTITPGGVYDKGSLVTITASPTSGYRFDRWSGDATGTSSTVTLTMDSDKTVTANFIAQYTLTTSASPSTGGTITPAGGTYDEGSLVIITANPAVGYRFDHWSGDAIGTSSTVTLTMDSDKSVTAHFEARLPTYSEVLKTYPSGVRLCKTNAHVVASSDSGWSLRVGPTSAEKIEMYNFKLQVQCYGTKITLDIPITIDGQTYKAGAKLTVDKNLNWIEVSSWD